MGERAWHSYYADSDEHSGRGDVYRIETLQSWHLCD